MQLPEFGDFIGGFMKLLTIPQICELEQVQNPYFKHISKYQIIAETDTEVLVEYTFIEENTNQKISASRIVKVDKSKLTDDAIVR